MVERLPRVFRVLALCFIVIQFIGICCIIEPNEEEMMQIEKETHNNKAITEKPVEEGMDPVSMMKTWKFWQVWLCLLILSYVNIYISSFYKVSHVDSLDCSSLVRLSFPTISSW